jgi:DNA-binding transcriptional LysR family regulator
VVGALLAFSYLNRIAKNSISGIHKCMADKNFDWSLYRSFLAVVKTGSLSAAARALDATQPTIGRHIAALETVLGGKALFTRSQRGLLPTEVARELLPHAEAMASSADAFLRTASAQAHEVAGAVRISASDVIGAEVLPDILADFRIAYPQVDIELSLSNQTADLLRRDADIAVRMVKPAQKALLARKVGTTALGFHASRRYFDRHSAPRNLEELLRHTLIGFDKSPPSVAALKSLPIAITRELFAFRCDNDLAQLAAIRAGIGIGICQYGVARRSADLVPILADEFGFGLDMWVVMHENLKKVRRVHLLFDHLAKSLSSYAKQSSRA